MVDNGDIKSDENWHEWTEWNCRQNDFVGFLDSCARVKSPEKRVFTRKMAIFGLPLHFRGDIDKKTFEW